MKATLSLLICRQLAITLICFAPAYASLANYESWRALYWEEPDLSDDSVSGRLANPDGDPWPNSVEYAVGTHPLLADTWTTQIEPSQTWGRPGFSQWAIGMPINPEASEADYLARHLSAEQLAPSWASLEGATPSRAIAEDGSLQGQILLPDSSVSPDTKAEIIRVEVSANPPEYVWIEAEDYTSTSGTSPESSEVVSDGEWVDLSPTGGSERFIEWNNIQIPSDGSYNLYVRKFWRHGPFQWSIDGSEDPDLSGEVTSDVSLLDEEELYTFRVVNWVFVDSVELTAGTHTLRIVQNESEGAAAYDVVLFIKGHFDPRGSLKPEERYDPAPEEGFFDFQPVRDSFQPSPLDLSFLNEDVAGSRGFIAADGPDFVYPDNQEVVKFWGINVGPEIYSLDHARIEHLARFYAKRGINHVRLHGSFYEGEGPEMGTVKPHLIDRLHYAVNAFKQQGIYCSLSVYFPLWVTISAQDERFPGYDDETPFAILFFNPVFEALYRTWWDALLTTVNPYTGVALKDEPAVLACELLNEDSFFFWTFDGTVPDEQKLILEQQLADWVASPDRYGSRAAALSAWMADPNWEPHPRDNDELGTLGVLASWEYAFGENSRRKLDTMRFLAEMQKDFYERNRDYLRHTIGFPGLIQGTNWITASPTILDPIEKWSNASMDYLDRHGYFDTAHFGFSASYAVANGNIFQSRSALRFDDSTDRAEKSFGNPVMAINYANKPSSISEINWPEPNQYRADVVPFIASYAALQGVDSVVLFRSDDDDWTALPTGKFPMQTPTTLVQFPGSALIHRRGLVQTGSPAVEVDLYMDNLWNREGTPMPQPQNLDNLRDPGVGGGENSANALSFLVGPVNVDFIPGEGETAFTDNSASFIDETAQTVTAITGELKLDYGEGLLQIDAPQAQGVLGFLSTQSSHALTDVSISSDMEYASIVVVAIDNMPLSASHRMLVQVSAHDRLSGFTTRSVTEADLDAIFGPGEQDRPSYSHGRYIEDIGRPPVMAEQMQGTLQFNRPDANQLMVYACDENLMPVAKIGSADSFQLKPEVFYYLIHRPGAQ